MGGLGLLKNWRVFTALLLAVVLSFLLFQSDGEKLLSKKNCKVEKLTPGKFKLLYVGIQMMALFLFCFPHMGVVGFLPVALLPFLSVEKTGNVASLYMSDINMEFFATTLMGIALGCTQLQTRFVYLILSLSGIKFELVLLIIMWTSAMLAAFISSSAATFIMIPVAVLIKDEISNILIQNSDTHKRQINYKRRFTTKAPKSNDDDDLDLEDDELLTIVPASVNDSLHSLLDEPSKTEPSVAVIVPIKGAEPPTPEKFPPKAENVVDGEDESEKEQEESPEARHLHPDDEEALQKFEESVLLTIGKAANIGGILFPYSTIISDSLFSNKPILYDTRFYDVLNNSKVICSEIIMGNCSSAIGNDTYIQYQSVSYDKANLYNIATDFTLRHWVVYTFPIFIIILIVNTYMELFLNFTRKCSWCKKRPEKNKSQTTIRSQDPEMNEHVKMRMREKYYELGSFNFREACLGVVMFAWALLFFFRDPRYIQGWSVPLKTKDSGVHDSCMSILFLIIFFAIPTSIKHTIFPPTSDKHFVCEPMFSWSNINKRIPWGIVLMIGGASAVVGLSEKTLLNDHIARIFANTFQGIPHEIVLLFTLLIFSIFSQLFGNVLIVGVAIPILIAASCLMQMHPLYLTVPVTVTCILSFVLPVASIPNAILYHEKKVTWMRMVKMGLVLNAVSISVVYLVHISYAEAIFNFKKYPSRLPTAFMCPLDKSLLPFGCHKGDLP